MMCALLTGVPWEMQADATKGFESQLQHHLGF